MDIYAKVSGTWKDLTPFVRVDGAWKNVNAVYSKESGVWKQVYTASLTLTVEIDETALGGSCNSGSVLTPCEAFTSDVTVTPTNGVAPYTYAWELVSGVGATIDSPNSATTSFSSVDTPPDAAGGDFRCLVTDANGNTGYSPSVTVTLQHFE